METQISGYMIDSEEKINSRATIKAPANLVGRILDESRRLRKKRGLTKDPPAWSVIEAAMDAYEEKQRGETATGSNRYEKYREEIENLVKILSSGNPIIAAAIRSNLDAFSLIRHSANHDSKIFFPATSQQELEVYAIVERILHEVGLPPSIRQNFFGIVEEAKSFAAENDKKLLEMPRKNA